MIFLFFFDYFIFLPEIILTISICITCLLRFFYIVYKKRLLKVNNIETFFNVFFFKEHFNYYYFFFFFIWLILFCYYIYFFFNFDFIVQLFLFNNLGIFNIKFILITKFTITLLCFLLFVLIVIRLKTYNLQKTQYYFIIIFFILLGNYFFFSTFDFFIMFLSLELINFSCVIFLSMENKVSKNIQNGFKYLYVSVISSSFFLISILISYFYFNTTNLLEIKYFFFSKYTFLTTCDLENFVLCSMNSTYFFDNFFFFDFIVHFIFFFFVLFYVLIKLYIFPGYKWALFIYESTNYASLFLLSSIVKYTYICFFFFVLHNMLFEYSFFDFFNSQVFIEKMFKGFTLNLFLLYIVIFSKIFLKLLLFLLFLITICYGVFRAATTTNLKKFFYWSSLSDSFFFFFGFSVFSNGLIGFYESFFNYFFIYSFSFFSICLILTLLREKSKQNKFSYELTDISSLSGISDKFEGILLLIIFISLAGIPPFNGFYAKFSIISKLIEKILFLSEEFLFVTDFYNFLYFCKIVDLFSLFFVLCFFLITMLISTWYYLKIVRVIFFVINNKNFFYQRNRNNFVIFCTFFFIFILHFFYFFSNTFFLAIFSWFFF